MKFLSFLEKNKSIAFFAVVFTSIFIYYISSLPNPPSPQGLDLSIPYHFFIFFILTFFLTSLIKKGKMNFSYLALSFLLAFVYAITDEIHQIFVPNRVADFFDIAIDSLGIISSLVVYSLASFKR